jgi:hypothetical protein
MGDCSLWRSGRRTVRRAQRQGVSPACPNGVWPVSCPSPTASTRSSFRRSARAGDHGRLKRVRHARAVVVTRRVDEDLRLALEPRNDWWTMRSRSRWNGVRTSDSASGRSRRSVVRADGEQEGRPQARDPRGERSPARRACHLPRLNRAGTAGAGYGAREEERFPGAGLSGLAGCGGGGNQAAAITRPWLLPLPPTKWWGSRERRVSVTQNAKSQATANVTVPRRQARLSQTLLLVKVGGQWTCRHPGDGSAPDGLRHGDGPEGSAHRPPQAAAASAGALSHSGGGDCLRFQSLKVDPTWASAVIRFVGPNRSLRDAGTPVLHRGASG